MAAKETTIRLLTTARVDGALRSPAEGEIIVSAAEAKRLRSEKKAAPERSASKPRTKASASARRKRGEGKASSSPPSPAPSPPPSPTPGAPPQS